MPTSTFEHIATATATGSSPNLTISSIPSTYTNLYMVVALRSSDGRNGGQSASLTFNGDTGANYYKVYQAADNTSGFAGAQNNVSTIEMSCVMNGSTAGVFWAHTAYINQYKNTNMWKTVLWRSGAANFPAGQQQLGYWRSLTAISSLNIQEPSNLNWVSGSYVSLYGMVGA